MLDTVLSWMIIVLFGMMAVCIPFFLQQLGEASILFTTVKEGTAKAIVRGKSFERFIMSFEGRHLNDPGKPWFDARLTKWEVVYHGDIRGELGKDAHYDNRWWPTRSLGLYWIGWPWSHSVYVYAFEWNETATDREGKQVIRPRAEATDYVVIGDFTYAIKTDAAETADRLPTDELTLVTVAIQNPYRALFNGEDWMRRTTSAINRLIRDIVGRKTFAELISSDLGSFSGDIARLSRELPGDDPQSKQGGLEGRYGVEIRTADLQTVTLTGKAQERNEEAAAKQYVATQDALAASIKGKAEADVARMKGEQEAVVIALKGAREAEALDKRLEVIKRHGKVAVQLAGYDALQESAKGAGSTIIWANDPLGPLASLFPHGHRQQTQQKGAKQA